MLLVQRVLWCLCVAMLQYKKEDMLFIVKGCGIMMDFGFKVIYKNRQRNFKVDSIICSQIMKRNFYYLILYFLLLLLLLLLLLDEL